MEISAALRSLGALSQQSRLEIFRLLVRRGPAGHSPGELQQALGIAAPTLSFHLKELQQAGLIDARRSGRFLHYSADFQCMNELVAFLTENCCSLSGTDCGPGCAPILQPGLLEKSA